MKRSPMPKPDKDKLRAWQQRSAGLKRSSSRRSRRRVNPRNTKRRAEAYARNYGERADAIRAMPCLCDSRGVVCMPGQECSGDITASHTRARGMGGCKGDARKQVPLCYRHSVEAGEFRTSQRAAFNLKYSRSLKDRTLDEIADEIALDLDEQGYP